MAALPPLVTTNIVLQPGSVNRAGFGTPLFCAQHRYFPERTRSYSGTLTASEDFPTASNTYIALTGTFSQNPSVSSALAGRIEANQILTPEDVVEGSVHSVTVAVGAGDVVVASYTAGAAETAEDVCNALKSQVDAEPGVAAETTTTVNGVGAAATLTIAATDAAAGDVFYTPYENITGLTDTYTSTESAADLVNNIREENDDWFFMETENHTEAFVLAMAAQIETLDKLYFVSLDETLALSADETSILRQLEALGYLNTAYLWTHQAPTNFTEAGFVGRNAPFDAGSVTWANISIAGAEASKQANGNLLTGTQQNNLYSYNANFIQSYRGKSIVRRGTVVSGEYIDTMRGLYWLKEEINVEVSNLLLNQVGGKVPYTTAGITRVKNVIGNALQRAVNRGYINEGWVVNVPDIADIPSTDFTDRILRDVTFSGTIQGAIHEAEILGSLSPQ